MRKVRLSEVTVNLDSKRKPLNNVERNRMKLNPKYPYFGANGQLDMIDDYIFDEEIICIAEDGGNWSKGSICSYIVNEKCWVNNHAHVLKTKKDLNIRFLMYYLNDADLSSSITGTTRGKLTKSALNKIEIPLPSLETQKKIVEVLDKAKGLIDARKEQIRLMDELIQSVFYEMFGEREIYPIRNVDDICIKITDGTHQSPQFVEQGIPFLFVSNIVNGKIIYNTSKFISRKEYASLIKRTPIENGDILYTIVGSYGNPAIVKSDEEFCFQRHIAYLKPNKEIVDSEYLATAMVMPDFKYQLEKKVKGMAQKTLNLSELKTMQVMLPPISTQYLFRDKVEGINKTKETLNDSLLMLEISIKSLMRSAFKGELFGGL